MQHSDLPRILELEKQLFPNDPWDEASYRYELNENPFAHCIVYEIDGHIVGYADYWITYEIGQLSNIGVDEVFQNKSIAKGLLKYVIEACTQENCETISLEVRQSNVKAIGLYTSFGFIKVANRKAYYQDGEDADLMVLALGGSL